MKPKQSRLDAVKAAHDRLSEAIEDTDGSSQTERDAAIKLCQALNDYYPEIKIKGA